MTISPIDYLIVAMDYATTCAGTCPTCVLTKVERDFAAPASSVESILNAMRKAGAAYEHAGTLAVGIGRANVLALPESSIAEIVDIMEGARSAFAFDKIIAEISTSLIGKIEAQIDRAKKLSLALAERGFESRYVIVANTALSSEKYWGNLDRFLTEMEDFRGGRMEEGNGDILQLALAVDSLPDVTQLANRFKAYGFPINLTWAPGHDKGAADLQSLERLGLWLAAFYSHAVELGLDASIVTRIDNAMSQGVTSMMTGSRHAERSSEAVVYLSPDGNWHNGLFTALAEMDPVRFDPASERQTMAGTSPKELRQIMANPACRTCPYIGPCVSVGGHKIGLIALRQHEKGTSVCPSGLKHCFALAEERIANGEQAHV